MIVVINQDLVAQVRHAWIADQQHPQRGRRARVLPDSERLGILLDAVFRASLLAVDAKPMHACVACIAISAALTLSPVDTMSPGRKVGSAATSMRASPNEALPLQLQPSTTFLR